MEKLIVIISSRLHKQSCVSLIEQHSLQKEAYLYNFTKEAPSQRHSIDSIEKTHHLPIKDICETGNISTSQPSKREAMQESLIKKYLKILILFRHFSLGLANSGEANNTVEGVLFHFRGFCPDTLLEHRKYTLTNSTDDPNKVIFIGEQSARIEYDPTLSQWALSDPRLNLTAWTPASHKLHGLGKHNWTMTSSLVTTVNVLQLRKDATKRCNVWMSQSSRIVSCSFLNVVTTKWFHQWLLKKKEKMSSFL